ncbi:hypothetical protein J4437_06170 [Candidatus Woesearchaeota archaeon]|nr:hypothetical protein [Candidatus Woesearchaeota archaeon]
MAQYTIPLLDYPKLKEIISNSEFVDRAINLVNRVSHEAAFTVIYDVISGEYRFSDIIEGRENNIPILDESQFYNGVADDFPGVPLFMVHTHLDDELLIPSSLMTGDLGLAHDWRYNLRCGQGGYGFDFKTIHVITKYTPKIEDYPLLLYQDRADPQLSLTEKVKRLRGYNRNFKDRTTQEEIVCKIQNSGTFQCDLLALSNLGNGDRNFQESELDKLSRFTFQPKICDLKKFEQIYLGKL